MGSSQSKKKDSNQKSNATSSTASLGKFTVEERYVYVN